MQESHSEGVANHTDPELCVASRKAGDEALVGARAGRVLSPESTLNGVPTLSPQAEG
jgi:RNA-directed DNA polymerase